MPFPDQVIEKLQAPLDPKRVAKRLGSGGKELSYLEGFDVINTLNEIFGYEGWDYSVIELADVGDGIITARVRLEVAIPDRDETEYRGYVSRTDVGVGTGATNAAGKEKAYKEAVTDGLKRAARGFGEQFGNSLYDKFNPIHDEVPPSTGRKKSTPTKTTTTTTSSAPRAPLGDLPDPNGPDGTFVCETCQAPITDSAKYTAAERARFSKRANNGQILCFNCQRAGE